MKAEMNAKEMRVKKQGKRDEGKERKVKRGRSREIKLKTGR